MTGTPENISGMGGTSNDAVASALVARKRRRILKLVIGAHVVALLAAIAGCLMLWKAQGVKADIAEMREEVGESLTMMSLEGANEAVARHLPRLIDTTARWDRKFAAKSESFRGLDEEINQAQAMHRLGAAAKRWRKELEGISPMQRNEAWQKTLKAQIEAEQKKWPNRTHKKGASEWAVDLWKEFYYGLQIGVSWPYGLYSRSSELVHNSRSFGVQDIGDCLRYVLFPYVISSFTMLRLLGIVISISGIGYLFCWAGLRTRFGALSYIGLAYFFYLINIALFIVFLEVFK